MGVRRGIYCVSPDECLSKHRRPGDRTGAAPISYRHSLLRDRRISYLACGGTEVHNICSVLYLWHKKESHNARVEGFFPSVMSVHSTRSNVESPQQLLRKDA